MDPATNPARVIAVSGHRNSGKTTLVEALTRRLTAEGLRVAWIKRTHHALQIDQPGKDTDRLFNAGADVGMESEEQHFMRRHPTPLTARMPIIQDMLQTHDLVLVEGGKPLPIPKVWCARPGEPHPPADVENIVATLPWDSERIEPCFEIVRDQLEQGWKETPIFGGVLIGGHSERMGRPKQSIEWKSRSFARTVADALTSQAEQILLLGDGPVPADCGSLFCLPDPPGVSGPLAGMLSAMRWAPDAAWLFAACDMPLITAEALAWLREQRRPGRWAVLPTLDGDRPEPLLSIWELMMRGTLEHRVHEGHLAPRLLKDHTKAEMIAVPAELQSAWKNINTPTDLDQLK